MKQFYIMDRKTKMRERLKFKLAKKHGKSYTPLTDETFRKQRVQRAHELNIQKCYRKGIFDAIEYTCFNKDVFIKFLNIMASEGDGFDIIDQKTVDCLNTFITTHSSYEDFMEKNANSWYAEKGSLKAFKFLFDEVGRNGMCNQLK
jgi:hypothetical protein